MKLNIAFIIILIVSIHQCKSKTETFFAGGFKGGTYDTMAKSLQENKSLKVKVINSNGSLDNINLLLDKKADFCLTQVDMYYSAKLGNPEVAKQTTILLPVLQDEIHLLVNSSIKSITELKGKKIAIGHSESGIKATSISVLRLSGIDFSEIEVRELGPEEAIPLLLKKEIDAVFVVSGLPVKILSALPEESKDKIKILNFEDSILDKIKADNKVYGRSTIPANTYSWQKEKINTLQVQTVLLARKDLPTSEVTEFIQKLFSNVDTLSSAHPEWNGIRENILKEKLKTMPDFFHATVKEKLK
jgi:hypothetical protein